MSNHNSKWKRRLILAASAIVIFLVYAYATSATHINLQEPLEPRRQANLYSLIRSLARPDILEYDTDTRETSISLRAPCPDEVKGSQVSFEGRTLLLTPNCVTTTQDRLTLSGTGFPPFVGGFVRWYPPGATTTRVVAEFKADAEGAFSESFTMPDVRESEEPQQLEVVEILDRRITGVSDTTVIAVERIIETIFMALMASTIGTFLAIPISFLAARNLMEDVTAPLASVMAAIFVAPIGWLVGSTVTRLVVDFGAQLADQAVVASGALVAVLALSLAVLLVQRPSLSASPLTTGRQIAELLRLIVAGLLLLLALVLAAQLGLVLGKWLESVLGFLGFLGNFLFVLSQLALLLLVVLVGLITALATMSLGAKYGQEAMLRLETTPARLFTAVCAALGTAVFIYSFGLFLNWLYQFENPQNWTTIPALIGGGIVGLLSLFMAPKRPLPIGMTIYTITRTVLNVMRAIEPVILGFVFVVWVGIGPFAGIMALMLHSIADLGKLFSEQVENIDEGPVEAVTATGANRIQMITYAVIPQVIPHYTAFIFYRWDINVRMSTIIGFVGGGGIGLVLQRFTNLTQYRQASVLVIAIALVVTILDYMSSRIRRRIN